MFVRNYMTPNPVTISPDDNFPKTMNAIHKNKIRHLPVIEQNRLIGINNRDLRTFEVSLQTTLNLVAQIPEGRLVVTESGIHVPADVAMMRREGVHAFLVGEAFMRAAEPGEKLRELFF